MADGRTKNGGRRPGAGRKPKVQEQDLIRLLDEAMPLAKRKAILKKLVEMAIEGDIKAAALLLSYAYGKPKEQVTIGGSLEQYVVIAPDKAETIEKWEQSHAAQKTSIN